MSVNKTEALTEVFEELSSAMGFMLGMSMDGRLPSDTKGALAEKVGEIDTVLNKHHDLVAYAED